MNVVSVRSSWESYRQLVVPPSASDVQVEETMRAFYAGALIVYEICLRIGEDDVSVETADGILQRLGRELQTFVADKGNVDPKAPN